MARPPILPFLPYLVIAVVHLASLLVASTAVSTSTKPLLMPALLLGFLWALRRARSELALIVSLAILFSWLGDILLGTPGDVGFLLGLGSFFLAHVAYLVVFLRPLRRRRVTRLAALLTLWWAALIAVLAPHLGTLLVPVALYGLVLGAMASAALACNGWIAGGALLFLVSDTLLALKLFLPGFVFWQIDFVIMLLYVAAQGLIAFGAVQSMRAARSYASVVASSGT
ncbi:lysoplasmalogenase [Glaciihabitans sp. UYNi722]|uniref:lysoplasmalogenase n=1 Tax=Glaciihabitans sp. UYNi722 TaxID=3156344 RepID=UPI0033979F2B